MLLPICKVTLTLNFLSQAFSNQPLLKSESGCASDFPTDLEPQTYAAKPSRLNSSNRVLSSMPRRNNKPLRSIKTHAQLLPTPESLSPALYSKAAATAKLAKLPAASPATRHSPMNAPAASLSCGSTHSGAPIIHVLPMKPLVTPKPICTMTR